MATAPEAKNDITEDNYTVIKLLAENAQLILTINEYQKMGRGQDSVKYQEVLHRNLVFLAKEIAPSCLAELAELGQPTAPPASAPQPPLLAAPQQPVAGFQGASPSRPQAAAPPQAPQHPQPAAPAFAVPHPPHNGHMSPYARANVPPNMMPPPGYMPTPGHPHDVRGLQQYVIPPSYPASYIPQHQNYMSALPPPQSLQPNHSMHPPQMMHHPGMPPSVPGYHSQVPPGQMHPQAMAAHGMHLPGPIHPGQGYPPPPAQMHANQASHPQQR